MTAELELAHKKIVDRLNKLTISEMYSSEETHDRDRIRDIVEEIGGAYSDTMRQRLLDEYFSSGPLEAALANEAITEILINRFDSIWIEENGSLRPWPHSFLSEITYENFCERVQRATRSIVGADCPFGNGQWHSFRVHIVSAPIAQTGTILSLRRKSRIPWRLHRLQDMQWANESQIEVLKGLIRDRVNLLVVGGTGTGKTSVLNSCLAEVGEFERSILIEDTSELDAPNPVSLKLLTRYDPHEILREISQADLVKQSLRMRPDRLIMGEIRGPEAKDLLMAFATGHAGCMGTMHADSARQALLRLEMLIQLGAAQWSPSAVKHLIYLSVRAIVVVHKDKHGNRKLEGIYKITALEEIGFLLEKMA